LLSVKHLHPGVVKQSRHVHIERRLQELGYALPAVADLKGNYRTSVRTGNYIFTGKSFIPTALHFILILNTI
jgi:hypothetical protein